MKILRKNLLVAALGLLGVLALGLNTTANFNGPWPPPPSGLMP